MGQNESHFHEEPRHAPVGNLADLDGPRGLCPPGRFPGHTPELPGPRGGRADPERTLAVDPYMQGHMSDAESYARPLAIEVVMPWRSRGQGVGVGGPEVCDRGPRWFGPLVVKRPRRRAPGC